MPGRLNTSCSPDLPSKEPSHLTASSLILFTMGSCVFCITIEKYHASPTRLKSFHLSPRMSLILRPVKQLNRKARFTSGFLHAVTDSLTTSSASRYSRTPGNLLLLHPFYGIICNNLLLGSRCQHAPQRSEIVVYAHWRQRSARAGIHPFQIVCKVAAQSGVDIFHAQDAETRSEKGAQMVSHVPAVADIAGATMRQSALPHVLLDIVRQAHC